MPSLFQDNDVERAFTILQTEHDRRKSNPTGKREVLEFLLEHPGRIWFWSWEFVGQKTRTGGYLGHRAPARASDLALKHPQLVEDRKIGRFKVYRLRTENLLLIRDALKTL